MSTAAMRKPPQGEAEIRALIDDWSQALEAKDLDALTAVYAPDVHLFDIQPPFEVRGIEAYREAWEKTFAHFPANYKSEHRDLKIAVDGDVAFVYGLHRITSEEKEPSGPQSWIRVTACFRRIEGRWRVVHEHVSLPIDMETGKLALITDREVTQAN